MLTSATNELSCPDRLKSISHQNHLSLMSGSGSFRVVVIPDWGLLEGRRLSHPLSVHPRLENCARWSWLIHSRRLLGAVFAFFTWNCIFRQRGPHGCSWWQLWELRRLWALGWWNFGLFPFVLRRNRCIVSSVQPWLVSLPSSGDFYIAPWCGNDLYDKHTFCSNPILSNLS